MHRLLPVPFVFFFLMLTVDAAAADAAAGKASYTVCAACHGQDATGGSDANTDLTRSEVVKNDVGGKQFAEFLENGRPEQRMPPFVLEADKVKDLAAYLHSISVLTKEPQ